MSENGLIALHAAWKAAGMSPDWPIVGGCDFGTPGCPIYMRGTPAKARPRPIQEWEREYIRRDYESQRHATRRRRYIEAMPRKLVCQDCRGEGGWTEAILDDGTGPSYDCGWCGGLGYQTPWERGEWLRLKKAKKHGWE